MSTILDVNTDIIAAGDDSRLPTPINNSAAQFVIFNYRSAGDHSQTWTVPDNVSQITIKMWGAGGGGASNAGGGGGYAYDVVYVNSGDILGVIVGQGGSTQGSSTYGGGGAAGPNGPYNSGAGGGRSEVTGSAWRLIAGGGGGGALYTAGAGGGTLGQNSSNVPNAGYGGTQSAGGAGGTGGGGGVSGSAGSADTGGAGANASYNTGGAGGGGGYYGGGGGGAHSNGNTFTGGGGSGHGVTENAVLIIGNAATPGNSSDSARNSAGLGGASGIPGNNGLVIISYIQGNVIYRFPPSVGGSGRLQVGQPTPMLPSVNGQIGYDGTNVVCRTSGYNRFCPAVPSGAGGILYDNGSDWVRLTPGNTGQFLKCNGTAAPSWGTLKSTLTSSYIGSDESLSGTGISFTSVVIPANALTLGSVYQAIFTGSSIACDLEYPGLQINVGTNKYSIAPSSFNSPFSALSWMIEIYITCRTTGASGSVVFYAEFIYSSIRLLYVGTSTVNTTASIPIYTYIDSGSGTQTQAIGMLTKT